MSSILTLTPKVRLQVKLLGGRDTHTTLSLCVKADLSLWFGVTSINPNHPIHWFFFSFLPSFSYPFSRQTQPNTIPSISTPNIDIGVKVTHKV